MISASNAAPRRLSPLDIPPGYGGPIHHINENDVLSGRGGRINSHAGNVRFRNLVGFHKHTYLAKTTKKLDKVKIADLIVKQIRNMNPPGRFLKDDADFNCWMEIGDEKARKKAGQAMREKAPQTRQEIEEGKVTPFEIPNVKNDPSRPTGLNNTSATAPLPVYSGNTGAPIIQGTAQNSGGYNRYLPTSPMAYSSNINSSRFASNPAVYNQAAGKLSPAESGKAVQSAIPENPKSNEQILGAGAAAFDRVFNPLKNSGSSSNGNSSSVSSLAYAGSNKTSSSSQGLGPTPESNELNDVPIQERSFLERPYQHLQSDVNEDAARRQDLRRQYQEMDRERSSYLPSQLTDNDPLVASTNTSLRSTDMQLLRSALFSRTGSMMSLGLTRSRSLPGMGPRDMSMDDASLSILLGDSDAYLNSPELSVIEGSQSSFRTSSNGSKSNSIFSEIPSDFSYRENSGDNMSVESKRSSASSWLGNFRGMQNCPGMEDCHLRSRLLSESSNRSLLSEISVDMEALDLALYEPIP